MTARVALEQLLDELGDGAQLVAEPLELVLALRAARPRQAQGQQQQGSDLGRVRLGRRHADLQAGAREQHVVGVARGLAAHDVAEREDRRAGLPGEPHGGERVGRLARLGDADHQRVGAEDGLAVAELAGHVDLHRHARQLLDGVAHDEAGVIRGAAGDDEDAPQAAQHLVADADLGEVDGAVLEQAAGERVAKRRRLLVDLLEHEGLVAALLGGVVVPLDDRLLAHERRAADVAELRAFGAKRDDVAVLEEDHGARVRHEGGDRRGEEHLAVADADDQRCLVARAHDDVGLVGRDGAEGVVAVQQTDRLADRSGEAAADALLDEMRHHLGVGLAGERVTALRELGAQLLVVLDDAVERRWTRAPCSRRAGGRSPRWAGRASPSACGRARRWPLRCSGRTARTARRGCRRRARISRPPSSTRTMPAES